VIAPTGTIAKIAECSTGIEPIYRRSFKANVMDTTLTYTHPLLEKYGPEDRARLFKTADEISPEWHILMQEAWQEYVDDSISKTINCPKSTTPEQILDIYNMALESPIIKGLTVFRDGCLGGQVLDEVMECPDCLLAMEHREGCEECPACGLSLCAA